MTSRAALLLAATLSLAPTFAQSSPPNTTTSPTTEPAPKPAETPVLLDTPKHALDTYLSAALAIQSKPLKLAIAPAPDPAGEKLVAADLNFNLWQHYLERACLKAFGPDDGLKIFGNARPIDDQLAIDLKRAANGSLDSDPANPNKVTVFLRAERSPITGNQTQNTYILIRDPKEKPPAWRVDYLATYRLLSPSKEDSSKMNLTAYPLLSAAMQKLAAAVKAGTYKSIDDVKDAYAKAEADAYHLNAPENDPKTDKTDDKTDK